MVKEVEHVLPENRSSVSAYLDTWGLHYTRMIFRAPNDVETDSTELLDLVRQRMERVEDRLSHRLQARKYVVDAAQDVEFINGTGRIEKVGRTLEYFVSTY